MQVEPQREADVERDARPIDPACLERGRDVGLGRDDVMMIWLPLGLNWGYLTLLQVVN